MPIFYANIEKRGLHYLTEALHCVSIISNAWGQAPLPHSPITQSVSRKPIGEHMHKRCDHCGKTKTLSEFFAPPFDSTASWKGTSQYCMSCHAAGLIKHGYGWYGDKYRTPEETPFLSLA